MSPLRAFTRFFSTLACCSLGACAGVVPPRALDAAVFPQIDQAIQHSIDQGQTSGAAFWLERQGQHYEQVYGRMSPEAPSPAVALDTIFDAASLTKVVVTSTAVQLLMDEGKLGLDDLLVRHLPECAGAKLGAITLRHLLTHTSGLLPSLGPKPAWQGKAAALQLACAAAPTDAPGTLFRYSDINFILLGLMVERVSGQPLEVFAQQRIFAPLGMASSGYLPLRRFDAARIAPTQRTGAVANPASAHFDLPPNHVLQGVVHDPTARFMGGVAGHAGLFTTLRDLAAFGRMLVDGGVVGGQRFLSAEAMARLSTVQSAEAAHYRRSAGWDIDTPFSRPRGTLFPVGSYGHTGFTGCILWIDPFSRTFYVFLSNRVYPDDSHVILPLYTQLGTLSAQAVRDFDFRNVPGALAVRR